MLKLSEALKIVDTFGIIWNNYFDLQNELKVNYPLNVKNAIQRIMLNLTKGV